MREAHMRDFIAVLEAGSVRGAARLLNLNQGAVSKNLTALERELGVPLLVRTQHGVEATAFGRILLRRARLADSELRKAHEEIAALAGHDIGIVNVALSSTAEAVLAAPAIRAFRERHPDTLVNLRGGSISTLLSLLREGKLDLAVGPEQPAMRPDIRSERLFSADVAVVARAGHPRASARTLAELKDCEWVHGVRPGDIDPAVLAAFTKARLPSPRFAVQRDSFSALIHLLMQTDYLGIASQPAVEPFCRLQLLTRIPVKVGSGLLTQCLLTPAGRPLAPHARHFAAELRRAARAHRR